MVKAKKRGIFADIAKHPGLYLLLLPGLLYFIIFKYVPMAGLLIAFKNFSPYLGFFESDWVGLFHFRNLFASPDFMMIIKNTLGLSLVSLVFYFPAPIILALLLNEVKNLAFKRVTQTFVYIPHFISYVIVATLTYQLFNVTDGIVNQIIKEITGSTIPFLSGPQYFRGLIVGQSIWKETGYGTIVFLAALSGVDTELYEAASVDGAGRWKQMWHITLPAIKGTIIIMLILRVGAILNTGFEQIFLVQNSLNISTSEVFDTYVYTRGIKQGQYSYATAVGFFKSVVGMILVLGSNWVAKRAGESGLY